MTQTYIVATTKDWNIAAFHKHSPSLPGDWHLITSPEDLTAERITELKPRFIFFPHWSWLVKSDVLKQAECVCFHAADVPYGRGGSPIQNLIARGHTETKLTALRMVETLDAGPVYTKVPLDLRGRGQDIFERMGELTWDLIAHIVHNEPSPAPQQGEPVVFSRRTPEQSALPETGSLDALFDHIRMLDVDTYPHAFLDHGDFRLEFERADVESDAVTARVSIRRKS